SRRPAPRPECSASRSWRRRGRRCTSWSNDEATGYGLRATGQMMRLRATGLGLRVSGSGRSLKSVAWSLLFLCAVAHADMTVQARGSAPVTGGDAAGARARALDEALRQAVDQAVAATVEPAARAAGADTIKKRILRRASAYVPQYKVAQE